MKLSIVVTIITLLISACNLPGAGEMLIPNSNSTEIPWLIMAPSNATATTTPFQPLPITATYLPTLIPTDRPTRVPATPTPIPELWNSYPPPSEPSDYPIPAPLGILPQPEGQVNILLLGSDQRPYEGGFRTDTILLVTLNPDQGIVNLTSFPRDLYVYIPGWTMNRINTAHAHGGFETTQLTFEYNFGVRPDHFIMINFWSFTQVIDSLGGIDVYSAAGLGDHREGYGHYYVPPGWNHMDGATALWYVRSRYTTSDFERTNRQQEVLQAIFFRLLSFNAIKRARDLYQIYTQNVTTDIQFADIKPLLPLAAKITDASQINQYFIGREQATSWLTSTGAQVLLPDRKAVLKIMRQALNIP